MHGFQQQHHHHHHPQQQEHISQTNATILSNVKWSVENDAFLSDFVQRYSLPHLALITKGQHLGIGAPNASMPCLKPYVLICSKQRRRKLVGQVMKLKEGKGRSYVDQKVAIPETFSGYFEILSEDGRAVKCLESVAELFQKFPDVCVVRQTCKAYVPDANDGELRNLYKTRTLREGETLTLCGQFYLKKINFLRCFDETGRSVYLKMSQKCKFSVVAKRPDAITGVHTVENLMTKRLPLTVKLIHGQLASDMTSGKATPLTNGHLVLRLQTIVHEEDVFAYSMTKSEGQFLSMPLNAHLKLAPAANNAQLAGSDEFDELVDLCDQAMINFYDRITQFNDHQFVYDSVAKNNNNSIDSNTTTTTNNSQNGAATNGHANSQDAAKNNASPDPIDDQSIIVDVGDTPDVSDDEIDQLYDYIRGLAPLPDSHRPPTVANPLVVDKPPLAPQTAAANRSNNNSLSTSPAAVKDGASPGNAARLRTRRVSSPQAIYPCAKNGDLSPTAIRVAEKRLDDILYGGGQQRRLSKSSDKIAAMDHDHRPPPPQPPLLTSGQQLHHHKSSDKLAGGGGHHNYYQRRAHPAATSCQQRPLSMVILDGYPAAVLNQQTYSPPPVPHEFYPPRYMPATAATPHHHHHQGYRSFVNLTLLDDPEPPPSYHSNSPPGIIDPHGLPPPYFHFVPPPPTAAGRPVYSPAARYVSRYGGGGGGGGHHYAAADYGL